MTALLIVLIVVLLVVILMQMAWLPTPTISDSAYTRRGELLTPTEQSFFIALEQAVNRRYRIFCQVRIADVLKSKGSGSSYWRALNRISQKHFDFVLCHPHSFDVVMAIELDDQSHDRNDRIENDRIKNAACESADLPLLRWSASTPFHAAEIESQLVVLLSTAEHGITQSFPAYIPPANNNPRSAALWMNAFFVVVLLGAGYLLMNRMIQRFGTPMVASAQSLTTKDPLPATTAADEASKPLAIAPQSEREKELAWNHYYTPDRNCENPKDWKVQVECANVYMRKKKEFEAKWASGEAN